MFGVTFCISFRHKCGHTGSLYFRDGSTMHRIAEDVKAAGAGDCPACGVPLASATVGLSTGG